MIQSIRKYASSIIIAVVIATAFFIHMGFPSTSEKYDQAKTNWEAAKSESANLLSEIKQLNIDLYQGKITFDEFSKQQPSYVDAYIQISEKRKKLHKIAVEIRSEDKFLQFKSFQYFLGEIGWAAGLFLYALVNLFNTFYLKLRYVNREFTGKILLHSSLLFIGCFYTFYVFYSKDDFSREWYFLAMALCTVALVLASKYITDSYIKRTEYLRKSIQNLIAFIFRVRTKHYGKVSVKALYAEQQNVVIDAHGDTVEDNNNEFDEDFYQTMLKIDL